MLASIQVLLVRAAAVVLGLVQHLVYPALVQRFLHPLASVYVVGRGLLSRAPTSRQRRYSVNSGLHSSEPAWPRKKSAGSSVSKRSLVSARTRDGSLSLYHFRKQLS